MIDCGGTSLPVCSLQSIRMMLAIAAELDYKVFMLGVQTAFMNAEVEKDVFAKMAPGYDMADKSGVSLVMKLKKNLYGFRQSPKHWFNIEFRPLRAESEFGPLKSDPCIYVLEDDTGFVILTLYVNDVLLLGGNERLLNKLKKQLKDCFEMADMSDVSSFYSNG